MPHLMQAGQEIAARAGGDPLGIARSPGAVITPAMQERLASAYHAMPSYSPDAVPAYRAMAEETARQLDYLTRSRRRGGLGVDVQVQRTDPYTSAGDMMRDVYHERRLKVFGTGGEGGEHPFFTPVQNDAFRAVHDAFGHALTGRGFDRHGEEAAFQAHASMYSPLARQAMATETRGQNAAFITSGGQQFPEQKVGVLPQPLQDPATMLGRRSQRRAAILQARQFTANLQETL